MGFRARLIILCQVLSMFTFALGIFSTNYLEDIDHNFQLLAEEAVPKTVAISVMQGSYRELRIQLRSLGIEGIEGSLTREVKAKAERQIDLFESALAEYKSHQLSPAEQTALTHLESSYLAFLDGGSGVFEQAQSATQADRDKLNQFFKEDCPRLANHVYKSLNELLAHQQSWANDKKTSTGQSVKEAKSRIFWLSIIFFALSIIIGGLFSERLLSVLMKGVSNVASHLSHAMEELSASSADMSESSTELSGMSKQQADRLNSTAEAADEIRAIANSNLQSVLETNELAQRTATVVYEGSQATSSLGSAISEIAHSNGLVAKQIAFSNQELQQTVNMIKTIADKVNVINDIVFQTKLLSFNASVEAARAGRAGDGFAVVANEIGNLAEMSGEAAQTINALLDDSIQRVSEIAGSTEQKFNSINNDLKARVENGVELSKRCGEIFGSIDQEMETLKSKIKDISESSEEQTTALEQIVTAVHDANLITTKTLGQVDRNLGQSRNISNAVHEINGSLGDLNKLVKRDTSSTQSDQPSSQADSSNRPSHLRVA